MIYIYMLGVIKSLMMLKKARRMANGSLKVLRLPFWLLSKELSLINVLEDQVFKLLKRIPMISDADKLVQKNKYMRTIL